MRLQARETNYGARIDYVLVTRGLLPWIKHGDILSSLKGSDHCPIYIDLHDEVTLESGETVKLSDAMKQKDGMQPPRIAAKYWEELAGKQTMLSNFFGKRGSQQSPPAEVLPPSDSLPVSESASVLSQASATSSTTTDAHWDAPTPSQSTAKPAAKASTAFRPAPAAPMKRKPLSKSSKQD